jgi:hypothetical protein
VSKRVLIVEDQEDLRGMLRDLLAGADYSVIEAADGTAGIAMAKSEHPDLRGDEANKGRSGYQGDTDHRGELVCHEGRRGEIALCGLRPPCDQSPTAPAAVEGHPWSSRTRVSIDN